MATATPEVPITSRNGDIGDAERVPAKLAITVLADRVLVQVGQAEGERRSRSGILIPATAQVIQRSTSRGSAAMARPEPMARRDRRIRRDERSDQTGDSGQTEDTET